MIKKKDALPFRIPNNINLVMVDIETGLLANINTKKTIYESFKSKDNFTSRLENRTNKDRFGLYDSQNSKSILRFY